VLLASIDVGLLFEVVWASAIAGAVVSVLFALVVLFGARSAETRRAGHGGAAMAYGALAVLAFAGFGLLVVYAVHLMLSKG
jgi:hypothetical protein